jgi:hypothetical protein
MFFKPPVAILLFIALAMVLIARGIVPAMSTIDTDFPNYFTAAKIVADGGDVERLYDNSWFREQVQHYRTGRASESRFAPFPPPTALLLVPLTPLQPIDALRALTSVSILCLIGSVVLLARIFSWSLVDSAVFVLLSGYAITNSLRFGQPYILVSSACILGYYALLKGKPFLAGVCFGLFAPVKYFPVVFLIYFAFRKEWRVVLGGAAAILVVASISVGVLGWRIHENFLSSVLANHLTADSSVLDPFSATYQSFDTLFRRLFIFDETLNPQPWFAAPHFQRVGVSLTKAAIFIVALATLVKLARSSPATASAPSIGILGILILLLAPATATYHFILLWLPVGLLADYMLREGAPRYAYFVLGVYSVIGFFPYRLTVPFEGRGGLTVLAYPRLFLLLTLFIGCIYFIWSRPARNTPQISPTTSVKV